MDAQQMVRRVQLLFGDTSEAEISVEFILSMLNDGQTDVARRTGILNKHAQTSAVANDGSYTIPEDFITVRRVTFNNKPLLKTSIDTVDQISPNYDKGEPAGTPSHYFLSGRTLFLHPLPSLGGAGNLDLWYTKMPTPLESLSDESELPRSYHEDVVRYALMRCKEKDDEYDTAEKIQMDYELRMTNTVSEAQDPYEDSYPAVREV